MGKIIQNSIMSYSRSKCRGLIPHPAIITSLCLLGGVDEEWGKEETYPRASPLTLTGVKKGPKNRGKEKEIEIEEEGGMKDAMSQYSGKVHPKNSKKFRET